jgi:hypothetical protein
MTRRAASAARRLVCVGLVAGLLAACGASPAPLGPTGIDGLVIPTPSPTPSDFVTRVDNPWFPLSPGTRWIYHRYTTIDTQTLVATVLPAPHQVDGVATTAVRWQWHSADRRTTTVAVRWYAQDRAGNVWWFGQRLRGSLSGPEVDDLATRSWQAGRAGARAGLLVAAHPRDGDGYANGYRAGVIERRSTVVSLDSTVAVPHRSYRGALTTRDVSGLEPKRIVQSFFARGVGLVAQQTIQSVESDLSLVRIMRP